MVNSTDTSALKPSRAKRFTRARQDVHQNLRKCKCEYYDSRLSRLVNNPESFYEELLTKSPKVSNEITGKSTRAAYAVNESA